MKVGFIEGLLTATEHVDGGKLKVKAGHYINIYQTMSELIQGNALFSVGDFKITWWQHFESLE